jgi:hypothetical protein
MYCNTGDVAINAGVDLRGHGPILFSKPIGLNPPNGWVIRIQGTYRAGVAGPDVYLICQHQG